MFRKLVFQPLSPFISCLHAIRNLSFGFPVGNPMELLLHFLAERAFVVLSQAGIVRVLLKELLIESYVDRLAIDLHTGYIGVEGDDLGPILVFFAEIAERVRALDVGDNLAGREPVTDVQAVDGHFHVGFVDVAAIGRHAGDPRVGSLEGNDVFVVVVGLFGFGETAGGRQRGRRLGWDEVLIGLCNHSADCKAVGVIQESSWGFEALHL